MDILIKGMEMQKACSWYDEEQKYHACRFCLGYMCQLTGCVVATSIEQRHPSCILRELSPHGRLVNLDDVYEAINRDIVPKGIPLSDFYKAFEDIPTVLEAST